MTRKEQAIELHKKGFNCAQCVACVFAEDLGYDEATVFKLSEAFGGGMGTFSTCGAVSGMAMVIGMKNSDGNIERPATKAASYGLMREATKQFLDLNSSTICKDLKGMETGEVLRSCNGCIKDGVEIVEKLLGLPEKQ